MGVNEFGIFGPMTARFMSLALSSSSENAFQMIANKPSLARVNLLFKSGGNFEEKATFLVLEGDELTGYDDSF